MKQTKEETALKRMRLMSDVFFILAALCAVYFVVIILYAGLNTAYCSVWIFFCILFSVMGHFIRRGTIHHGDMPRFIPTFIFTTFILFSMLFIMIMTSVMGYSRYNDSEEFVPTDYTIVMGARVYSNGVSKTLMYRLERALDYYHEHPETTLVLTGGIDNGDVIPEALSMFNFFSMHGVPSERMLIDTRATNTMLAVEGAVIRIADDTKRRQIPEGPGQLVWPKDYVPSVAVVTSDYHMMRVIKIAQNQGIAEPMAVPARSDKILFLHQCVRESAAVIKDYLMGNFTLNERELPFSKE